MGDQANDIEGAGGEMIEEDIGSDFDVISLSDPELESSSDSESEDEDVDAVDGKVEKVHTQEQHATNG